MYSSISTTHWETIKRELMRPTAPEPVVNNWRPTINFGVLPPSLDAEVWTADEWRRRGFPFRNIPVSTPSTLIAAQWDEMAHCALQTELLDPGWIPHMKHVRSWLVEGTPVYLQPPGTTPTKGKHHITEDQMQMTLESVRRFQLMVRYLIIITNIFTK